MWKFSNVIGFDYKYLNWKYISRLLFSTTTLFCSVYLNLLSSSIAGYRTPWIHILDVHGNLTNSISLPDIGHDILPYIDWFELPNYFIELNLYLFLFLFFFHPKKFQIFRRSTMILSIIYILRSYTVLVTSLPDASPLCYSQFTDPVHGAYKMNKMFPDVFFRAFNILKSGGKKITCGDMIFSGHASLLILLSLSFQQYCYPTLYFTYPICLYLKRITFIISAFGIVSIIATRLHYTLDVSIAIYLTYRVWTEYHTIVQVASLKNRNIILRWLESDEILKIEG